MKRMVLVITLHRRYHEFLKNLRRTRERCQEELGYIPDIILVWACPEICQLWFTRELLNNQLVSHIIGRPALPDERPGNTTYPESHNIRLGLEYVRATYDPATHYAVVMSADIWVQGGTMGFFKNKIDEGHQAVVFHWDNGCVREGVWHTNCFAVPLNELYWPPVSTIGQQDVLERQWGLLLTERQPPGVFKWHNSGEKRFLHRHESEHLPPFPAYGEPVTRNCSLAVTGHKSWFRRCMSFMYRIFNWRQ